MINLPVGVHVVDSQLKTQSLVTEVTNYRTDHCGSVRHHIHKFPTTPRVDTEESLPRIKQSEPKANLSPPNTAEVKNE
jgi:hypothetical protein